MIQRRSFLLILGLGLLLALLQGIVMRPLWPQGLLPNPALLLVVFVVLHAPSVVGALLAFLIGLEFDLVGAHLLGPWAAAAVALFGVLSIFASRIFVESSLATFLTVFLSCVGAGALYIVLVAEFNPAIQELWTRLFGESFMTGLLAVPLFPLGRRFLLGGSDQSAFSSQSLRAFS